MESLSRRRAISTMGSTSTSSRKKISVSSSSTNSDSGEGTTSLAMNPSVFASGSFGKLLTQSESLSSLHSSSSSNGSPMGSGLLRVGSGFLESDDDSTSTDEEGSPGGNKRFSTMLNKLVRRKDSIKKSTTGSGSTSAKVITSHSPLPEEEMALLMPGEKTRGIHGRTKASLLVSGSTHMIPGILLVTNYRLIFIPHYSTTSPSSTSSFSASMGDLHKSHTPTPAFLLSIPHRVVDFAIPLSLLEEGGLEELTRSNHRLSRRITGDPLWLEESPRNPNVTKRIRSPCIPNTSQGTFLILSCCDVQKYKFAVPNDTDVTTLSETINLHTDSIRSGYRAAFEFSRSWIANESFNRTLWQPYSPDEELKRFNQTAGVSIGGFTRSWVLVDNSQNVICSRYPPRILVPFTISQDLLQSVPSEYSDNMFPIPIFSHSAKQCVLWRAGSFLDAFTPSLQSYLKILSSCSTPHSVNNLPLGKLALVVVVLGDRQNFQSLLLVEPPPKTKIEYLDVPLLYPDVGSAFNALKTLCLKDIFHSPNQKMKNISPALFNAPNSADTPRLTEWLEEIASSEWVKCVAKVIAAAGRISHMMAEDGCGVLVQSGLSSVVSILSQLLTDGELRTIRGFARLLEKDWPAEFDPPMDAEDIFISPLESTMPVSQKTPLMLILLLDCVHQISIRYPTAFEFNDNLLTTLLDEHFLARFESSLTFPHSERLRLVTQTSLVSLWAWIGSNLVQFRNPAFKEVGTTTLLPVTDIQSKPWCEYFLRDLFRFHMDAIKFTYSQQPPEDVRAISFTKEGLPFLPSRFLASFSALQSLDLSENNIFHVPPEVGELTQLKKLRLNNNHITRLSSCILRRLTQLEELNLGSNEISWIEGLDGLLRLKKIKLAKNRLGILPVIPSPILESLEISDNPAGSTNKEQFFRSITANVKNVDINSLGLQIFPTDLLKAKGTLFLFVGGNNLSQLPMELSSFSKLQLLRADRNPFKVIPSVVFQFKTLRTLSLDGCDISVIESHIGRLTNLRSLSLVHNRIESLPPDLFTLLELRTLEISQNRISYLPPEISNLSMLEDLGLGDNHLSQLPSTIAKLNNLITLDLSNNSLQYLNSELASLSFLQNLNLSGNPLRNPPTDIVSQGTKAVLEFLRSPLGQEVEACYRLKLMLVGQENAGKTSVLRTLRKTSGEKKEKEPDVASNVSTDGIQIGELYASLRPKEFDKKMVKVRFDTWDFAGQEVYYTSHPFFLTEQSIYLLVWNLELTDGESRVLYWLQSIFQKAPNSPVILVGTHAEAGLKQCTWIVNTAFRKYQTEFPNLFGSVAVSCVKGQIGFDKLWQTIESALQQQEWLGDFIPTRYFKLEKILKDESIKRTPPVLTQLELTDICGTLSLAGKHLDYAKAVMERFGALFHLSDDKHLSDIVVIDLSWLINMISSLLTTRHTYCKAGMLQHSVLRDLWRPPEFPESTHVALVSLLQKFQIAFCLTPDTTPFYQRTSLVPSLLPEERPPELDKKWPAFASGEFCQRIFTFDFVPLGFFSRYLVRILMRQKGGISAPKITWRHGLLLESKRKSVLIEMHPALSKLSIGVRGHPSCKLFTYAVDNVAALAKWYNLTFTTEIPCIHCHQIRSVDPYSFSLKDCEAALKEGLSVVYCRGVKPVRIDKLAPDLAMADIADRKVEYSQLTFDKELGEGSFAKVYSGTYRNSVVAIKQIKKEAQDFGEFRRELWAMSGLNHANVVELVGFCTVPLCIISEYVPEGNLYELIHDKSKPLSLALQLRIAMDIAKALRFLHWRLSPPMIHNDLKSPNVLLVSCKEEADVIAKITDFGLSRQTFQDKRTTDEDGNPRWLAPEVLRGEQYGNKIDIYALGIILWEMTTRDHFLDHKFMYVIRDRILAKERPVIPDETIPQLRDTISKCWCDDPEVRPDVNYCIETLISAIGEHTPHLLAVATAERPVVSTRIVRKPSPNESVTREALQQKEVPFRANRIAALVPESSAKLQPIRKLEAIGEGSIFCLLYAKHYKQVWCGDGRGTIKVLSEDGEVLHTSKCHEKMITTLVWIKPYIWSGSVDGSLKVWHKSMVLIKEIKNMQASSIIKVLEKVWVSTLNMELLVLNKKTYEVEKKIPLPLTKDNVIGAMIYKHPYVWLGTNNAVIRVLAEEERVIDVQGGHTKLINQFISVEDEIWSCSSDSCICVWDDQTGQCKRVLTGHTGRVFGMVLEKSHRSVVWSCSWDKMILVWDVQSKRLIAECSMDAHKDAVSSLSQIGGMIWSTSWDKSICQWHTLGLMDVVQATKLTDFDTFAQLLRVPANFSTIYASMPKSTVRRSNMLGSGSGPLLGTGSGPHLSLSLSGIGASALKTGKQIG